MKTRLCKECGIETDRPRFCSANCRIRFKNRHKSRDLCACGRLKMLQSKRCSECYRLEKSKKFCEPIEHAIIGRALPAPRQE